MQQPSSLWPMSDAPSMQDRRCRCVHIIWSSTLAASDTHSHPPYIVETRGIHHSSCCLAMFIGSAPKAPYAMASPHALCCLPTYASVNSSCNIVL